MRFLKRAVLSEVGEDGGGFFDAGHDPPRAAAVAACAHVDVEDAPEPLRPEPAPDLILGHRAGARWECGGVCSPRSIPHRREAVCRAPMASAARATSRLAHKFARSEFEQPKGGPEGEGQDALSKDAMEPGHQRTRWRHQRRQLADELRRPKLHVRRAVFTRRLELVAHPS